jgi:hypothetical protein
LFVLEIDTTTIDERDKLKIQDLVDSLIKVKTVERMPELAYRYLMEKLIMIQLMKVIWYKN